MTADRTCPLGDAALSPDRYVCRTCTGTLRGLLSDLSGLMGDLDVSLAEQARFGETVGGRSNTTALAFGYAASEAGYVARQNILVWIDSITAVRGHAIPATSCFRLPCSPRSAAARRPARRLSAASGAASISSAMALA